MPKCIFGKMHFAVLSLRTRMHAQRRTLGFSTVTQAGRPAGMSQAAFNRLASSPRVLDSPESVGREGLETTA